MTAMEMTPELQLAGNVGAFVARKLGENGVELTYTAMYRLVEDFLFERYRLEWLPVPSVWADYLSDIGGYQNIPEYVEVLLAQ